MEQGFNFPQALTLSRKLLFPLEFTQGCTLRHQRWGETGIIHGTWQHQNQRLVHWVLFRRKLPWAWRSHSSSSKCNHKSLSLIHLLFPYMCSFYSDSCVVKSKSRVIPAMAGPTLKGVLTCSRFSLLHLQRPLATLAVVVHTVMLQRPPVMSRIPKVPKWWDPTKGPGRQSSNLNALQAPEISGVHSPWQNKVGKIPLFLLKE